MGGWVIVTKMLILVTKGAYRWGIVTGMLNIMTNAALGMGIVM